nr:hypothetical protein [Tanacetum cinerariifolium]
MQEFWATISTHHHSLHFKMNDRSHTLNVENFRDMLQICPRLSGQRFEDPPFEEEIPSFIQDLDSKAYKEYYVVASRAVPPKVKTKYKKKTNEFVTSPKSKTASASKGTRHKSKAKVTKPDMKKQPAKKTKVKGLAVLSQVPDEQVQKTSGTDEGTGTIPGVPDVPPY